MRRNATHDIPMYHKCHLKSNSIVCYVNTIILEISKLIQLCVDRGRACQQIELAPRIKYYHTTANIQFKPASLFNYLFYCSPQFSLWNPHIRLFQPLREATTYIIIHCQFAGHPTKFILITKILLPFTLFQMLNSDLKVFFLAINSTSAVKTI